MRRLPPFFALRALEAAARHRSYSRAADELAVTHGAVSQQIRRLEDEFGQRLFTRRGNAMIPTPEAERLAIELARGFDVLQNALAEFHAGAERDPLVISLDPGFGSRWLPSRLALLLADPAGANLKFQVEERLADFVTDGVDVGVRYGKGGWKGLETQLLVTERLLPVCSPKVAGEHAIREPKDLFAAPLLHHVFRPWRLWFSAFGLEAPPPGRGMVFNDSVMLVEAAAQGLGVALARSGLIEGDLRSGRLVRLLGAVDSEFGFYLVWRRESRKLRRIHALRDWLMAHASAPDW